MDSSCFLHVERVHLTSRELPDAGWLSAVNRKVCPVCWILVPVGHKCRLCKKQVDLTGRPDDTLTGPSLCEEPVLDTEWEQVLLLG